MVDVGLHQKKEIHPETSRVVCQHLAEAEHAVDCGVPFLLARPRSRHTSIHYWRVSCLEIYFTTYNNAVLESMLI